MARDTWFAKSQQQQIIQQIEDYQKANKDKIDEETQAMLEECKRRIPLRESLEPEQAKQLASLIKYKRYG